MEKKMILTFKDQDGILSVGKAISNQTRIDILNILSTRSTNLKELSEKLGIPFTTCASNVDILEKAGLISTSYQSGQRGLIKLCSIKYEEVDIGFMHVNAKSGDQVDSYSIPIGSYSSFEASPTCGLAGDKGFLGRDDYPATFYSANRFQAQLLWMSCGFVEYTIPLKDIETVSAIRIRFEICSEAPNYRNDFPSDITFSINGTDLFTWTCPGDFGGRRGKYTPSWWDEESTQYGLYTRVKVDAEGSYLNHVLVSSVGLSALHLSSNPYIRFRIGIKKDAKNVGGFNLFGSRFGDYPMDIELEVTH